MKALEEDTTKFPDPKLGKHNGWGAPATSAALQTGLMVGGPEVANRYLSRGISNSIPSSLSMAEASIYVR